MWIPWYVDCCIVAMSLISQNVLPRRLPGDAETDGDDESQQTEDLLEGEQEEETRQGNVGC